MTAIVGVHGVGNYLPGQPAEKVAARRSADWAASVAAGLGIQPDALDLTVAYYAPLLHAGEPATKNRCPASGCVDGLTGRKVLADRVLGPAKQARVQPGAASVAEPRKRSAQRQAVELPHVEQGINRVQGKLLQAWLLARLGFPWPHSGVGLGSDSAADRTSPLDGPSWPGPGGPGSWDHPFPQGQASRPSASIPCKSCNGR